jgi:hypothetical protein
MGSLLTVGVSTLILAAAPAGVASRTPIFDCSVDAVLDLLEPPVPSETTTYWRTESPAFTFDSASGLVRWKNRSGAFGEPERFDILQRGTSDWDWIAVRHFEFFPSSAGAMRINDVDNILRIRPWGSNESDRQRNRFYLVQHTQLWVGRCTAR